MANDVAKLILRHVESDNLSHLKNLYLSKHYRFNCQLGEMQNDMNNINLLICNRTTFI